jgi:hypothetical protein
MQLALETLDSQSRIALARDYVVELAKRQIAQKLATQLGELSKQLQSQPKVLEEALAEVQAAVGEALVRYSSLDGADPEFEDLRDTATCHCLADLLARHRCHRLPAPDGIGKGRRDS